MRFVVVKTIGDKKEYKASKYMLSLSRDEAEDRYWAWIGGTCIGEITKEHWIELAAGCKVSRKKERSVAWRADMNVRHKRQGNKRSRRLSSDLPLMSNWNEIILPDGVKG